MPAWAMAILRGQTLTGWGLAIPILWLVYIIGLIIQIFTEYENLIYPRIGVDTGFIASLLLSIDPTRNERQREDTAQILSLPGQLLHDSAAMINDQPGYQSRGEAVCNVLNAIPHTIYLFERLAEAGFVARLWPRPQHADGQRLPSLFQCSGIRASPC